MSALYEKVAAGGRISTAEMRDVFNLGVGMIASVSSGSADRVHAAARAAGVATWSCGTISAGPHCVEFRQ